LFATVSSIPIGELLGSLYRKRLAFIVVLSKCKERLLNILYYKYNTILTNKKIFCDLFSEVVNSGLLIGTCIGVGIVLYLYGRGRLD